MRAFEQSEEYKPSDLRYRLRDGLRFGYRQFQRMRRSWNFYQRESGLPSYSPRGHYYSPLPDIFEGQRFAAMAFNSQLADRIPGIDLQVMAQEELLSRMIDVYPEFDWSATAFQAAGSTLIKSGIRKRTVFVFTQCFGSFARAEW